MRIEDRKKNADNMKLNHTKAHLSICLPVCASWESEIHLLVFEPQHDKTNKMSVRTAKTQISLGIRFLHADSEDSDQTGRMPRLI